MNALKNVENALSTAQDSMLRLKYREQCECLNKHMYGHQTQKEIRVQKMNE